MKKATIFGVPGSHPTFAAELMLERKGIEYRRVDLVAVVHRGCCACSAFRGITVPAMRLDGRRVQGTRTIARRARRAAPGAAACSRATRTPGGRVEEAEGWGDEVLQPVPRRLGLGALGRDRSRMATYLEGAQLGVPVAVAVRMGRP